MSSNMTIPPYDWDDHFRIADDLRHLDLYYLQFTGKRPLEKGSIQNHLVQEFTLAAQNKDKVSISEYYQILSSAVDRMMILAEQHANHAATRAHFISGHLRDLVALFPEEKFHPLIQKELEVRGVQLRELLDNMLAVRPLYIEGQMVFHDDKLWDAARHSIIVELDFYKTLKISDPLPAVLDPANEAFLRTRSLKFAKSQESLAANTLDHARIQAELVEECLRLATTMRILPDIYRTQLESRMHTLLKVAGDLMVTADFTLAEAADLRNSAQLSRNLQRPIFKASHP